MSKDRQQRREQQASVTRDRDFIVVTAQATATGKDVEAAVAEFERDGTQAGPSERREQPASVKDGDKTPERFQVGDLAKVQADLPTMTAFELDTLGMRLPEVMKREAGEDDSEFRARLSVRLFALLPLPDRTPAEFIEHAERLTRGHGEQFDSYLARVRAAGGAEAEAVELRNELAQLQCREEQDRERIQQLEDTRRAALDELAEALKNGGTTSLTEEVRIAREQQREQSKPPANIPKAVHHLRKAANALPMVRDPIGEAMQKVAVALLEDPTITCHDNARRILPGIAAALDLDVHAGPAAKDVRAAIEALS